MTPVTRQTPIPQPPQQVAPSPRPMPSHVQYHAPQAPPSPAPTPKQEQEPELPQPPSRRQSQAQSPLSLAPEYKTAYYPKVSPAESCHVGRRLLTIEQLPWYSSVNGAADFPARATRSRRQRRTLRQPSGSVALPSRDAAEDESPAVGEEDAESQTSTIAAPSEQETPATSQAPSENDFAHGSAPVTPAQAQPVSPKATPTQQHARKDTRSAIAVPNIPKNKATPPADDKRRVSASIPEAAPSTADTESEVAAVEGATAEEPAAPVTPPKPAAPKSWADLVRDKSAAKNAASKATETVVPNGLSFAKSASLADALRQYSVQNDASLSFLEPRGLVNTGNMCYMNSVSSKIADFEVQHADLT